VSNELKGIKSYIVKLNQRLKQAIRQSMKEVIEMEVNTILTKMESLCEIVNDQTSSESKWTDTVTRRQKRTASSRHKNIYSIPVINNRYKLPFSNDVSKIQALNSAKKANNKKYNGKLSSEKKKKHRILIISDSHGRDCATKMMHNLDSDFEVQGTIKPGADLTTITKTVKKEVNLQTENDVIVIWGCIRDVSKNETSGLNQLKDFLGKIIIRTLSKWVYHIDLIYMKIPM
jgi:hypothetical protein